VEYKKVARHNSKLNTEPFIYACNIHKFISSNLNPNANVRSSCNYLTNYHIVSRLSRVGRNCMRNNKGWGYFITTDAKGYILVDQVTGVWPALHAHYMRFTAIIKWNGTRVAWSTEGAMTNAYKILFGKPEERSPHDPSMDGIILKWILRKCWERESRLASSNQQPVACSSHPVINLGLHRQQGISWELSQS
jgi:hypothetical protein